MVFDVDDPSAYGNMNESENFPRILKRTLDNLLTETSSESEDHDSCVQLIREYFCGFYYPLCHLETEIITPVCRSSCNMIFNNEHCHDLLIEAISVMEQENIPVVPSGHSCEETFLPLTKISEPALSGNCIGIAGTVCAFSSIIIVITDCMITLCSYGRYVHNVCRVILLCNIMLSIKVT